MTRHHVLVVHEDKNSFVRIREFNDRQKMVVHITRTAKALTQDGYAFSRASMKEGQETLTYRKIGSPTVYISTEEVGDSPTEKTNE